MIVVKIELWPWGNEERMREIGRMFIANTGQDRVPDRGDYTGAVSMDCPSPVDPEGPSPTRSGEVKDYPRLSYNVWRLITRMLLSAFPEEAKGIPPMPDHGNVEADAILLSRLKACRHDLTAAGNAAFVPVELLADVIEHIEAPRSS